MRRRPGIERLWRPRLAACEWPLWTALTPLAAFYAIALGARSRFGAQSERAPIPVISVGNLTVGGNGKTPFTLYLAKALQARGLRIGIVSRGYGRTANKRAALLVADRGKLQLEVHQSGDEPAMMAHAFDGPIAVAKRRIDGIRLLLARGPLDAIVLDDAFQHRRLYRDLDLALVASPRGFGNGWLLPAGPLRESVDALRRANAIILISASDDRAPPSSELAQTASSVGPVFHALVRPSSLVGLAGGGWLEQPLDLNGRRIVAVSGLANPASFATMLAKLGAVIVEAFEFPDHHNYKVKDWRAITSSAQAADIIVTTEKDLVKLQTFSPAPASLYALRLEVVLEPEDEARLLAMAVDCMRRDAHSASR